MKGCFRGFNVKHHLANPSCQPSLGEAVIQSDRLSLKKIKIIIDFIREDCDNRAPQSKDPLNKTSTQTKTKPQNNTL